MCDTLAMYITNIEKEGPFLKIWGQVDKKAAIDVERALYKAYAMYEEGKHLMSPGNLLIGALCCAKYIDEKYYRARITNVDTRCQGSVEVNFIDYGNRELIPIANLRSMDCFNSTFITLPPLALPFILSEVVSVGGEWNDISLEQISREIRYMEVKYKIVSTHLGYQIILIYLADIDLAVHLVQNSLMQSIPLETQESILSKMIPRTPQVMPAADQSLLQYKSVTLEPNSRHEVYVSYITDGPCHFSVQLKKSESILVQLMREINSIPLKPFDELPIPGTVCLAKCVEDSHICRAVITSEVDNQYKLFYVDFGNTEIVPPDNLYQMPFKYIIPKIMAIRLALDGVDKSTVTLEMQCAFKQFVDNRLLMMEVFPSPKKMALPRCRMWDPATNTDVMEILNKAAQLAYPNAIALHRGFTRPVKVTFVYSCNKFFIHLKSNEDELSQLMANIQVFCNSASASFLEEPKIGQPCCAQFQHDGQWYRSLIIAFTEDHAKVKYIDYGNEDDVQLQLLKTIEGEFLTCMRPQAIECCLNGYQNMTEDLERDNKLEELILDQEFTMKVIDIVNSKSLVDLIDSEGRSVTALLMEAMINQPKVQVVANGNFDNNTTKYGGNNSVKKNGKPYGEEPWSRDKSQNRIEKSEDWRQGPRKRNGSMSNDNHDSWRHKNTKNDNEWHDNTSNESFRKGRTNNENRKSAHTKSQTNNWSPPEKDKNSHNHNSYTNPQTTPTEWNGREGSNNRNRSSRQDNDSGFGNRENRNKPKNDDNWGTDNQTNTWGENEEFQGVKKRTKNYSPNDSNNRNRGRTDNEEYGNKKNTYNGNDFSEKKPYRDRNSYDSDSSSYKKGKSSERSFDGKPRYDRGDRKKPFRKDNDYNMHDNERTDGKKFNSRSDSKWSDRNNSNDYRTKSYNNSTTTAIDPAPNGAIFQTLEVNGKQKVTLSWFHNPCSFFCQLMDSQQNFSTLMEEIQELYKDKPSSFAVEGAPAIALFPEDNVFYRSRILKAMGNKYKVYYVDFGNISVVDSVWPIDKKFMELPMQAIPCGLGGIQPVGDEWPDPNAFTNYLQKDSLDCEFISYQVDRYMVNLYSNDQEIKQQLVNDNLAKYVETSVPSPEFDINLLAGHTFRAELGFVNDDLSDIRLYLSSGIELFCLAHNLASAAEIYEDELKERLGQVLIVYCDNIIDNRLEVTLYDQAGNKINIVNPDEGAYDTIEPICPYLLIKTKVAGYVSYVNETSIVIQPNECTELIETLLNEIYEHYENLPKEDPIIPEEESIYAVLSADSNWYRGRVVSFDDEKVTVTYIDYGNSEDVPFANLRELDPKFFWWDRMAILVQVKTPTAELLEKKVTALIHYSEVGLEGEILEVEDAYIPEEGQQPENVPVNLQAVIPNETAEVTEAAIINEAPIAVSSENYPEQINETPIVDGTAVVISHIDSPSDFYIQLAESQNAISDLQAKIQEQIGEMPVLETTSIGGLCAAPYSVDQMWYRSQILDADEDITTVRFIDYGNTDVIDNKATQIKTLPADLLALEEYARRCRLKIKPLEEEWSKPTTDRFEELAYSENVTVQFVNQDEKANYVELFSDGQNVKDLLIAENLAALDEGLVLDAKLKGYISHMNSPSEFWVQLDGWCAELEWIAEQLSNASSFPDLEDFTPGSLCAAMFPDDEMWYRARILSNTVAGLEVLFLDYGNSCVCANLKQLPEHLVMAPPLALKCCLQKPEGLFNWSPEAAQKFSEISADGQTEFTLKKLTTGETSSVELYVNNEEVSSKLLPTTVDVQVTDINSMDSFAVSKDGTVSDERYRLDKIPGSEYNEECLSKFVEINNEGKTCYGMELVADNTVRLYLNGNDIRNELLSLLKPQSLVGSPSKKSEICNETQTEENHDVPLEDTNQASETSQEQEICEEPAKEHDSPTEICEPIQDNEVCSTSQNEENGVSQDEFAQEQTESLGDASELCQTLLEVAINEASQENTSEIENQHDLSQEKISEICKTPQDQEKEEVCNVSQEDSVHQYVDLETVTEKISYEEKDLCYPSEKDNCEGTQEDTPKVCDASESESIHDSSQKETHEDIDFKEEEPSEIYETQQENENLEIIQVDNSGDCDTSQDKMVGDVLQDETSELPETEGVNLDEDKDSSDCGDAILHADEIAAENLSCDISGTKESIEVTQEEPSEIHETQQETENLEIIQVDNSGDCDTSQDKMIDDVLQDETPELPVTEEGVNIDKDKDSSDCGDAILHADEVTAENLACDISGTKESIEVTQEHTNDVQISEIQNITHEEIPQNCDIETKEPTQTDTEVSNPTPHEEIDDSMEICESCDNQIEDSLEKSYEMCITPNPEEKHEDAVQELCELKDGCDEKSVICDMKDVKVDTTPSTNETFEGENDDILPDSSQRETSGNCDVNDEEIKTLGAPEICDSPEAEETKVEPIQGESSEECNNDNDNIQEKLEKLALCDEQQKAAVSTEVCDITEDSVPIKSSEEAEASKSTPKVEFTETIMTSFSAPTVSEKDLAPKLSPTKINPKVQESVEDTEGVSSKQQE